MNVQELREALADLPAHWPVHIAVRADGSGGGADTDYLYTLDVQRDNFPTQGCMAVIRIDYAGRAADEEAAAFLRAQRKYPERPAAGVPASDFAGKQQAEYERIAALASGVLASPNDQGASHD